MTSFDDFCTTTFQMLCQRNPVAASGMGLAAYHHLWPDLSKAGVAGDLSILADLRQQLDDLPTEGQQEDAELLDWFLSMTQLELDGLEYWRSSPRLANTILSGITTIVMRTSPDEPQRQIALIQRLLAVPTLTEQIKSRLDQPVALWLQAEINSTTGLLEYLPAIPDYFNSPALALDEAINIATGSMEEYRTWLQSLEGGPLPINPETYRQLLNRRQFGLSPEAIVQMGHDLLDSTQQQLEDLASQLGGSIAEIRKRIRSNHAPDFETTISNYQKLAAEARQHILTKDLLTMPKEQLKVIPTPPPLRNYLSIAAASSPGKFDTDQTGYFYCTPHDDLAMLEEHSFSYQPLLIAHESYPGHHIHGTCKNLHPSILRSSTIFSYGSANTGLMYSGKQAEMIEGWGLYCESMMYQSGFAGGPDDIEQLFLQTNALRWRATRMIIDVSLHLGNMSYTEAVDYLVEQTGFHRTTADAEVLMYSMSPGYFLSYALGYTLIKQMRGRTELPQKQFHDAILYAGHVPYWFIRDHVLQQ